MKEKNFFELNEDMTNGRISAILILTLVAIPLVALFRAAGLFSMSLYGFVEFCVVGCFAAVTPRILFKRGIRGDILKYYIITIVSVVVSLFATNPHIGIYITYVFGVSISLFYIDTALTRYAAILDYILMLIAMYFRQMALVAEGTTSDAGMKAFWAYSMGFTIEFIVVTPTFFALTRILRSHLERENRLIDEIRNESERFKLSRQSVRDVFFEYDIKNDIFKYYGALNPGEDVDSSEPKFISDIKNRILQGELLFPGDGSKMATFLDDDLNGKLQLRLMRNGEPYWIEVEGHVYYDGNVQQKAIGRIIDINNDKLEEERRKEEGSGLDELTGFYERSAGIRIIRRYRNDALDGYHFFVYAYIETAELIRAKAGAVFCDACILRVAEIILSKMRSTDVAVRFSSDEFIIYFQDRTPDMIEQTIENIRNEIRGIYVGEGIAEFIDVTFKTYESIQDIESEALNSDLIKDINAYDEYNDDVISYTFTSFEKASDINEAIDDVLQRIGKRYSLDYIRVLRESRVPGLQYCINEWIDSSSLEGSMYGETISVQRMKRKQSMFVCDNKELGSVDIYIIFQGSGLEGDFRDSICAKLREAAHIICAYIVKDRAEGASRSKTDFLSSMSHEIRTPMNAIAGYAELALQEETSETVMEYATNILANANNMLDVINEMLDISKIEAGKLEIVLVSYYFHDIVLELNSLMAIQLGKKPVSFNLDIDPKLPDGLVGDNIRLRQILVNLLNNSVKFTQMGSITLSARWESGIEATEGKLVLAIKDTGRGIKDSELEGLFDTYSINDDKKYNSITGSLGLSITKNLVELMGGTIEADSVYGEGSEFKVTLPQRIFDAAKYDYNAKKTVKKKHKAFVIPFTTMDTRVLVVDDNHVNQQVAKGLLSKYQIDVVIASSGKEALDILDNDNNFDIVFMDHLMPEMDGIECTKLIRNSEDEKLTKIPIVALTANAIKGVEEDFYEAGMNGFLPKPINLKELCNTLETFVDAEKRIYINPEDAG